MFLVFYIKKKKKAEFHQLETLIAACYLFIYFILFMILLRIYVCLSYPVNLFVIGFSIVLSLFSANGLMSQLT